MNYSKVPNKRPVSNKRPGWKFLMKIGTIFGQMIKKRGNFFTEYGVRGLATIINF